MSQYVSVLRTWSIKQPMAAALFLVFLVLMSFFFPCQAQRNERESIRQKLALGSFYDDEPVIYTSCSKNGPSSRWVWDVVWVRCRFDLRSFWRPMTVFHLWGAKFRSAWRTTFFFLLFCFDWITSEVKHCKSETWLLDRLCYVQFHVYDKESSNGYMKWHYEKLKFRSRQIWSNWMRFEIKPNICLNCRLSLLIFFFFFFYKKGTKHFLTYRYNSLCIKTEAEAEKATQWLTLNAW